MDFMEFFKKKEVWVIGGIIGFFGIMAIVNTIIG